MVMGAGMMESHVSRFESGHYKKGHRHGPGAHLYITEGEGYVLTQRGNEPRIRCDWQEGSLYLSGAGEGLWLHQHFNVGSTPATYLVMNQGISRKHAANRWQASQSTVLRQGEVSGKKGGYQVEYEDEDPEIHQIFEAELKKPRHHLQDEKNGALVHRRSGRGKRESSLSRRARRGRIRLW